MASGLPWESLPAIAALSAVALLIVTDPGWRHWRLTVPTLTVIAGGWSLHFVLLAPSFGQRRGQGQALAPVEQAVAIAALALCAAAILRVLLRRSGEPVHARGTPSTRAHSSHLPLIVGSMLTLVFLAWLSMPAMLLHSEQFGFELLTDLHRFPEPATYRPSWGQVSFVVLGAAVRLTGSYKAAFVLNRVVGAAAVVLSALLARRWSGSSVAAAAAVVILGTHPGLARCAASEDPHTLLMALLFGGALLLDGWARHRWPAEAFAAGIFCLVLVAWTRQIGLVLAPLGLLVLCDSHRLGWPPRPAVLAGAATVLLASLSHMFFVATMDQRSFSSIGSLLARVLPQFLAEPHPIIDPRITPWPAPLFAVIGLMALPRIRGARWFLPLALGSTFLASALFCYGGPGVRLLFRQPVLWLWGMTAALGVGVTWRTLSPRHRRATSAGLLLLGSVQLGVATVGWKHLARIDPLSQELAFLDQVVERIPRGSVIVTPKLDDFSVDFGFEEPRPEWRFPEFLFAGRDVRVLSLNEWRTTAPQTPCALFYRSLLCHTLSLGEGSRTVRAAWSTLTKGNDEGHRELSGFFDALLEAERADPPPDAALLDRRAACSLSPEAQGPALAEFGTELTVPWRPYMPNLFYPRDRMPVGFSAISPGACRELETRPPLGKVSP